MAKKVKVSLVLHTMQTESKGREYRQREWDLELAESGSATGPLEQDMREAVVAAFPATHSAFIADMIVSDQPAKVELGGYTLTITPYILGTPVA